MLFIISTVILLGLFSELGRVVSSSILSVLFKGLACLLSSSMTYLIAAIVYKLGG